MPSTESYSFPSVAQIAIVSQEPVLFAATILYNICFGMPDSEAVTQEQARHLYSHAIHTSEYP